ncbi:cobalamin B12-binding domain-containing protein [Longimicrobium sp.]|uniref:cobalamin B12-binding domain-containing protein n=1 Tax=Longimicrobium sp. TaxID=2029185 RepID=UPI003B3A027A
MTAGEAHDLYLAAIRAGNRRQALGVVDLALAGGMDARTLYLQVFQPAMHEIGRLWQENLITVADEHLATAVTQLAMSRLYEQLFGDRADAGPLLVAACAQDERHELGLRMICDLLELDGWDTVFLGASVPVEDLVRMVVERRPEVVALSASITPHLARVREAVQAIREAMPEGAPVIAIGGRAFAGDEALAERMGADLTAKDAVEVAERLKERFAA